MSVPSTSPFETLLAKERVAAAMAALSPREVEMMTGLAHGLTHAEIARELGLSVQTVKNSVVAIRARLRDLKI